MKAAAAALLLLLVPAAQAQMPPGYRMLSCKAIDHANNDVFSGFSAIKDSFTPPAHVAPFKPFAPGPGSGCRVPDNLNADTLICTWSPVSRAAADNTYDTLVHELRACLAGWKEVTVPRMSLFNIKVLRNTAFRGSGRFEGMIWVVEQLEVDRHAGVRAWEIEISARRN